MHDTRHTCKLKLSERHIHDIRIHNNHMHIIINRRVDLTQQFMWSYVVCLPIRIFVTRVSIRLNDNECTSNTLSSSSHRAEREVLTTRSVCRSDKTFFSFLLSLSLQTTFVTTDHPRRMFPLVTWFGTGTRNQAVHL